MFFTRNKRKFNGKEYEFASKRQWGSEKNLQPLSHLHEIPSTRKIALSRLAIVATVGFWITYIVSTILRHIFEGPHSYRFTLETFSYVVVVTFLTFSALMYLIMRQGALVRFSRHKRVPRAELDKHFSKSQPSITVLIPSYAEETDVVRKTMLSAALQEYPGMRVVLLIDDKPFPTDPAVKDKLDATRALANEIQELFAEPHKRFSKALKGFEKRKAQKHATKKIVEDLTDHYEWAAKGLNTMADNEQINDHVDVFFSEQVLRELAKDLSLVATALNASYEEGAKLPWSRVHQLYRRLSWIFDVELTTFERKKYASLSSEPNKAMNLNSYIGLMGCTYREHDTPDGPILVPVAKAKSGDIVIPDSEYLLTLDADSILLKDYCLRLTYLLEQPHNANVAVTQTPYSSFRGTSTRIERLAGATTDVQHILHQGMSYYNATFWVGANAVIRKKALADIEEIDWEGGFEIKRYVQDWTVIEDTESSVDLAVHGWTLKNYPERLSYSATPPDFGSLIVQRRRWANGGLLILPKLLKVIRERRRKNEYVSRAEIFIRLNYMASIAWASFGLIFLLAYPYDSRLLSPLVLLAALPYFLSQASDLKYSGYKRTDIFRIYGFNLILLPVNLAGVLKSIQQSLTGKKIPFARTPKVKDRTLSSPYYIIVPFIIIGFSVFTMWRDINAQNWGNAIFASFNALSTAWATVAYIGIWNSLADIWHGLTGWLYVDVKPKADPKNTLNIPAINWQSVLYHGEDTGDVPYSLDWHKNPERPNSSSARSAAFSAGTVSSNTLSAEKNSSASPIDNSGSSRVSYQSSTAQTTNVGR